MASTEPTSTLVDYPCPALRCGYEGPHELRLSTTDAGTDWARCGSCTAEFDVTDVVLVVDRRSGGYRPPADEEG